MFLTRRRVKQLYRRTCGAVESVPAAKQSNKSYSMFPWISGGEFTRSYFTNIFVHHFLYAILEKRFRNVHQFLLVYTIYISKKILADLDATKLIKAKHIFTICDLCSFCIVWVVVLTVALKAPKKRMNTVTKGEKNWFVYYWETDGEHWYGNCSNTVDSRLSASISSDQPFGLSAIDRADNLIKKKKLI